MRGGVVRPPALNQGGVGLVVSCWCVVDGFLEEGGVITSPPLGERKRVVVTPLQAAAAETRWRRTSKRTRLAQVWLRST